MRRIASYLLAFMVAFGTVPSMAQTPDSSSKSVQREIIDIFPAQPELVGSIDSINAVLRYTPEAVEAGIEGRVFVQVLVEPGGTVSEVKVLRGLGYGLDEEAKRVARDVKFKWPKEEDRILMALPLTFRLPERK